MSARRTFRSRRCVTPVLLGALMLPMLAVPAVAVSDPTTGYWTRTNAGLPVPVQPPTPVPEGGTWVSGDPAGPVAVSAIRAGADQGMIVAGFRLKVADEVGAAAVVVCPTTERWAPEQGGRLQAAPAGDCAAPIVAEVEEGLLVIDLPALVQGGIVDLLLAPEGTAPFSLTLEKATAESVVQAPDPTASTSTPVAPAPPPLSGPPPFFDGGAGFGTPDLGAPAPAPGLLLPGPAVAQPAPTAAGVPQPQAAAPPMPAVLASRPPVQPVDRTGSLLAVALLAMLALLALRLAVQPAAPPRHLGGGARLSRPAAGEVGAPDVATTLTPARGVGRFQAPRLRPPVRI